MSDTPKPYATLDELPPHIEGLWHASDCKSALGFGDPSCTCGAVKMSAMLARLLATARLALTPQSGAPTPDAEDAARWRFVRDCMTLTNHNMGDEHNEDYRWAIRLLGELIVTRLDYYTVKAPTLIEAIDNARSVNTRSGLVPPVSTQET